MQHVTDEAVVNTSAAKWDQFINLGNRGKIEMGPSSLLDQVADEVIRMQSLHHNDDCVLGFIVEPRQQRIAIPLQDILPRAAGEPIMAIVSIKSQQVTFYDAEGWILRAPVSTGTEGRETPAGVFAIVERKPDHRSNMYDDAWMPHLQRITWNGIALHGGPLPGYAA